MLIRIRLARVKSPGMLFRGWRVILWLGSGAGCLEVAGGGHLLGVSAIGGESDAGGGEDVEAEVAASFGPFLVPLGQDRADKADQRVAAREDPGPVGAPAN